MIVTERLPAVSAPISALIVNCIKDEIDRPHAHLIERVEELERQLASTPKVDKPQCPTPLSLNRAYRAYKGRVILRAEAKRFKETLSQLKPFEKILGEIYLEVKLVFPDKRKRDFDKYLKVLLDSMKHVFFEDDDQIYELTVTKVIGAGKAETEIIINPL